jgi:MoxR-like ATPase
MSLEKLFNGEQLSITEARGPIAVLVSAARVRGERHEQVLPKIQEIGDRLLTQMEDIRAQLLLEWWLMCTTESRGIGLSHNANIDDYDLPIDVYEAIKTLLDHRHAAAKTSIIDWFVSRVKIDNHILSFKRKLRYSKSGDTGRNSDHRSWDELIKDYVDLPAEFDKRGHIPADPGWSETDFKKELSKLSVTGSLERKFRQAAASMAKDATDAISLSHELQPLLLDTDVTKVGAGQLDQLDADYREIARILLVDVLEGDINFKNHAVDELRRSGPSLKVADVNLMVLATADWLDSVSNDIPVISDRYRDYRLLHRDAMDKKKRGEDVMALETLLTSGKFDEARSENDRINESGRQVRAEDDQRARLVGFLRILEEARNDPNHGAGLWIDEIEKRCESIRLGIGSRPLEEIRDEITNIEAHFRTSRNKALSENATELFMEVRDFCEPDLYSYIDDFLEKISTGIVQPEELSQVEDFYNSEKTNLERRFQSALVNLKSLRENGFSDSYADLYSEWENVTAKAEDFDDDTDTQRNKKELLERMRELAGRIAKSVIQVWNPTNASEESDLVDHITNYVCERAGFTISDVTRFHVALKSKRFVVLAGITGTGKSTLARFYAEALGITSKNAQLVNIAVRPNWIDQSEVLGYVNPMTQKFHAGWLASLMNKCHRSPKDLHICVLDEMNLAPVEQYMAEVLSAIEHFSDSGDDPMITLYPEDSQPTNADEWPAQIALPKNLFFIGTVNVDESTRALTDRVIDRGHMIQLNVHVSRNHHELRSERMEPSWKVGTDAWNLICTTDLDDSRHDDIVQLAEVLQKMRIGVGIRTHIEIERFLANSHQVIDEDEAFDYAILQRLIPKIRGYRRDLEPALIELKQWLHDMDTPKSESVVDYWLSEDRDGDDFIEGTDPFLGVITSDE